MSESKSSGTNLIGILAVGAFLLFAGLKLTGHIAWSWWWVTAPLWGYAGFVLAILIVFIVGVMLIKAVG